MNQKGMGNKTPVGAAQRGRRPGKRTRQNGQNDSNSVKEEATRRHTSTESSRRTKMRRSALEQVTPDITPASEDKVCGSPATSR